VKLSSSDGGLILRTLVDANVQFVVIGEPSAGGALRLVVSRHPTNLEALGRALDSLKSSLRAVPQEATPGLHRIGDPEGTVAVHTAGGDVDLVFGGAHRSLYADIFERSEERDINGTAVWWSEELPVPERGRRVTGSVLSRRLLSLAEGLAHMIEREPPADQGATTTGTGTDPTGDRPPAEHDRVGGGAESNGEPESAG
jgi:hypothetical protein